MSVGTQTSEGDSSSGMEGVLDGCFRGGRDWANTAPPFFVTRADGSEDTPEVFDANTPVWIGSVAYVTYKLTPATPESTFVRIRLSPAVSGIADVKLDSEDLTDKLFNAGGMELEVPVGFTRGITVVLKVDFDTHKCSFVATRKKDDQHHGL